VASQVLLVASPIWVPPFLLLAIGYTLTRLLLPSVNLFVLANKLLRQVLAVKERVWPSMVPPDRWPCIDVAPVRSDELAALQVLPDVMFACEHVRTHAHTTGLTGLHVVQ
jgi:hypothetical protein